MVTLASNQPCPKCGHESLGVFDDGQHCFHNTCDYKTFEIADGQRTEYKKHKKANFKPVEGKVIELASRKISKNVCDKWNVTFNSKVFNPNNGKEQPCLIFNYTEKGKIIGQKLKFVTDNKKERYSTKGNLPNLYGKHLWASGGKKIVITEGELDALSYAEITNNKYAVVSIPNGGDSAKKSISAEKDWLEDNFEEIILLFDNDEVGEKAAADCYPLFSKGKCKIASLPLKDASDMLVEGKGKELVNSIFNATRPKLEGILTVGDLRDELLKPPTWGDSLPWPTLYNAIYGLQFPSLDLLIAGSGVGKTTLYKALGIWQIRENKRKVGIIFTEEPPKKTLRSLAGFYAKRRFDRPDAEYTTDELLNVVDEMDSLSCFIFNDSKGSSDLNEILAKVRDMVVLEDCDYVFIDHLTKFTDAAPEGGANKVAEKIMSTLSDLVMEKECNIQIISHTSQPYGTTSYEDGGRVRIDSAKGSTAIKQYAFNIFGFNKVENDETNTLRILEVLKCRENGEAVGTLVHLQYNSDTNELIEIPPEFHDNEECEAVNT